MILLKATDSRMGSSPVLRMVRLRMVLPPEPVPNTKRAITLSPPGPLIVTVLSPSMVTGLVIVGKEDVMFIIPDTVKVIVCGAAASALASVIACLSEPAPALLPLVTRKPVACRQEATNKKQGKRERIKMLRVATSEIRLSFIELMIKVAIDRQK